MEKTASPIQSNTASSASRAETLVKQLFETAGIRVNGHEPWDIQVHRPELYARLIHDGSLGFGESYMDHWWDCESLDVLLCKLFKAKLDEKAALPWSVKLNYLLARLINLQTKHRAKEVAYRHYDLGNELFTAMLDKRMIYSCAYWKNADTLDAAQEAKLDLICQKLQLRPGLRLLDIGCGWGGLAQYAASHYGVSVVGVTISRQQHDYAKAHCQGLPVDIRLQDYREIHETFDRIVSVGMFEHVGYLNYPTFMQTVHRALAEDGLFLLHTIGANESSTLTNGWLNKYIFPNGMIPSITQVGKSAERLFVMEDWHNFGPFYDRTLMAWHDNFLSHWPMLANQYDERFYRMWTFYLLSCAGNFRARICQLWQIVLSKGHSTEVYQAPR